MGEGAESGRSTRLRGVRHESGKHLAPAVETQRRSSQAAPAQSCWLTLHRRVEVCSRPCTEVKGEVDDGREPALGLGRQHGAVAQRGIESGAQVLAQEGLTLFLGDRRMLRIAEVSVADRQVPWWADIGVGAAVGFIRGHPVKVLESLGQVGRASSTATSGWCPAPCSPASTRGRASGDGRPGRAVRVRGQALPEPVHDRPRDHRHPLVRAALLRREGVGQYVSRMVNLTTLAPDIVAAILDDALPNHVTLFDLASGTPLSWEEQRDRVKPVSA